MLIDSSGPLLVCALADGEGVVAEARADPRGPDISSAVGKLLGELLPRDLTGIVVGVGPGSFIGTRTAISFANGYVASSGIPLYPVNSLAAIGAVYGGGQAAVLRDARRKQFFIWLSGGDLSDPAAGSSLVDAEQAVASLQARGIRRAVIEGAAAAAIEPKLAGAGIAATVVESVPAEGLRRMQTYSQPVDYAEPVYLRGFT